MFALHRQAHIGRFLSPCDRGRFVTQLAEYALRMRVNCTTNELRRYWRPKSTCLHGRTTIKVTWVAAIEVQTGSY
jgi:hypothetical protein